MRKRGPKGGFTLIELLVVIIIMSIIFALVAYSVSRMLPNMQIATASQQLLGAVGQARMLAVTKSAYVKLRLIPTGASGNSTIQDSIEILMKSPMDTLGWIGFNRVSITALSQGVKFYNLAGRVEYNFWRDGSLEAKPAADPQIITTAKLQNRQPVTKTLKVAKATGIAEMTTP